MTTTRETGPPKWKAASLNTAPKSDFHNLWGIAYATHYMSGVRPVAAFGYTPHIASEPIVESTDRDVTDRMLQRVMINADHNWRRGHHVVEPGWSPGKLDYQSCYMIDSQMVTVIGPIPK